MAVDIVLKDRNGDDVTYSGIETVTFDTPEDGVQATFTHGALQEGKEVELALADGDQAVTADEGHFLKELTIKKPETLLPENIRKGVNVAGVEGDLIGDAEETTVDLAMADGDQVVEPSAETKVLSKVVVIKPGTMLPENIKAGIDIGGVVGEFFGDAEEVTVELDFPAGSEETEILAETTLEFFDIGNGIYISEGAIESQLIEGETYHIVWDGVSYVCVPTVSSGNSSEMLAGNLSITDSSLDDSGEPFGLSFYTNDDGTFEYGFFTADTSTSHTVRIYQVTEGNSDMVVTPSEDGKVMAKVTVVKPETLVPDNIRKGIEIGGVTGDYVTDGTTKEIEPDFSEGDQTVTAEGDERWNEVVVKIPETLVPENIALGVTICGVEGTFAGGGDCTFDFSDENVQFFAYQLDNENKQIILYSILYDVLYATNGSYDVNIPDQIGGYDVVIACT